MTGNQKSDGSTDRPRGSGALPLYSLVALLAAIAGFLSVVIGERLSRPGATEIAANAQISAPNSASDANASSGLEKLVQSEAPKRLPSISFTDGDGRKRNLSEWRGRVVLLNLWATWCAPCKVEMPSLNRLQARLGGADFAVIPISLDWSGPGKPRRYLRENKLDQLGLYLDDSKTIMQSLGAPGLPLTVLIDREGRELARLAGAAEWDSVEAVALIRLAIEGTN
jgi:thiol-disulfide isomerase/thioredoxin